MPSRSLPPSRASARPDAPRTGERIAKLLARAGIASRREVERMIAEGRIALNGVAIDTPATVLGSLGGVTVDGAPVAAPAPARLFAYHKPPGLLVTERDPRGRATIYDRLPAGLPRVVPVGRLDVGTEGLLLLTTDGELKRELELPATGVERTYRARAYGPVSQAQLEDLIEGIEIDGVRYGRIDANLERRTGANTWIELTLTEGKNREVRRVLEHLGLEVSRLIRTRYGPFVLADMPPGAVGEVRSHDLIAFRQSLKRGKGGDKDMRVMAQPLAEEAVQTPQEQRSPGETNPAPLGPSPSKGRSATRLAKNGASTGSARTGRSNVPRSGPPHARPREGDHPPHADGGGAAPRSQIARKPPHHRAAPGGLQLRVDHAPRGQGSSGGRSEPNHRASSGRTKKGQATRNVEAVRAGDRPVSTKRAATEQSPRPSRPQRKPGWARAKPRSGPGRPKK